MADAATALAHMSIRRAWIEFAEARHRIADRDRRIREALNEAAWWRASR